MAIQTLNISGIPRAVQTAKIPVPFAASNRVTGAGGAAAVVTLSANTTKPNILKQIFYSYSAAPTGGAITVEDGSGNTVFSEDVSAAGPGVIDFDPPLCGSTNTAMIITLAAPGGGVVGKLNLNAWVEG